MLWQTDELRLTRPDPRDEARNAVYYLADLAADAAPQVLDRPGHDPARASASTLPPTARPLTFGTWIGGDRDGNPYVTPAVTRDVLLIQHEHGIRAVEAIAGRPDHRAVGVAAAAAGVARPGGQPGQPTSTRSARRCPSGSAGSTPRSRTGSRCAASQAKLRQHPQPAGQRRRRTGPGTTTAAPPSWSPTWS